MHSRPKKKKSRVKHHDIKNSYAHSKTHTCPHNASDPYTADYDEAAITGVEGATAAAAAAPTPEGDPPTDTGAGESRSWV